MRGTASGERERGCVRDRRPVMRCPSKRGKLCICSHALCRLFIKQQYKNSSGQPFSAAEAAFSITSQAYYGLQLKSMPRPRPTADMLFHQYVYFGLDPTPPAFRTLFFSFSSSYSRTVFFFPLLLHLKPVFAEAQRAYTAFSNEVWKLAFYISQSPLFPPCPAAACMPALFSSILHCLICSPQSSRCFSLPLVRGLFSSCSCSSHLHSVGLVPSLLTPHLSTYPDSLCSSFLSLSAIKTPIFSTRQSGW